MVLPRVDVSMQSGSKLFGAENPIAQVPYALVQRSMVVDPCTPGSECLAAPFTALEWTVVEMFPVPVPLLFGPGLLGLWPLYLFIRRHRSTFKVPIWKIKGFINTKTSVKDHGLEVQCISVC